jgi:hypothetical protein
MSRRKPAVDRLMAEWLAWPTCAAPSGRCRGVQLAGTDRCLAHGTAAEQDAAFQRLARGAPLDFARGVPFTSELLDELLDHAPTDERHQTVLHQADFTRAVLRDASFYQVAFLGPVRFKETTFEGDSDFRKTRFEGDVSLHGAVFEGEAQFDEAVFGEGEVAFIDVTFHGDARFVEMAIAGEAFFIGAAFKREAIFVLNQWNETTFKKASFARSPEFELNVADGTINLDDITFNQPVRLQVVTERLSCQRTRFLAGGHLHVERAEITLADADFPAPLIIARHTRSIPWLIEHAARPISDQRPMWSLPKPPSLVSVQRADVAGLVLADIDLGECHFAGAHRLDQMQFATADAFHRAPAAWGTGRLVLAEECIWRLQRGSRRGRRWHSTIAPEPSAFLEDAHQPEPGELAGIYRRLRKGREEAKNEPGAADFYYGECEMRRHARQTPPAEWWLLRAYWLMSGYGLRGLRALGCLAVIIAGAALAFHTVGFARPHSPAGLQGSLLYAAESTLSLVNPTVELTGWGRVLRMGLRLVGPLLLGLALLAVRNRVKR